LFLLFKLFFVFALNLSSPSPLCLLAVRLEALSALSADTDSALDGSRDALAVATPRK
jgi:hypothetical protein